MQLSVNNHFYSQQIKSIKITFYFFIIIVLTGMILSFSCRSNPHNNRLRITCFPILTSEPWLDILIADSINDILKKVNSADHLTYTLDWTFDNIEKDSIADLTYLRHQSHRIGLNILIVSCVESINRGIPKIQFNIYNPLESQSILQFTDSLDYQNPESFFKRSAKKIFNFTSVNIDSISYISFPKIDILEKYGWGRYHQLFSEFDYAEKNYRSVINSDTSKTNIFKNLVKVLLKKVSQSSGRGEYLENLYFEIENLILRAIDTESNDGELYCLSGNLYIQRGRWNKAEQALKKAFELDRDNPFIYFNLARLHPSRYRKLGFKNKTELLEMALWINPAFQLGWIALGENYYYQNRYDKAEEIYTRLLDIHPKSLDGLLGLGKLYMVKNDIVNIIRIYENVIEIAPDYADAYYNLGIVYFKDNKVNEAIQFFQKAIELNNHADSHYYLGLIYQDQGNLDQAIYFFRKRIELKTGIDDTFANEARIHLTQLLESQDLIL